MYKFFIILIYVISNCFLFIIAKIIRLTTNHHHLLPPAIVSYVKVATDTIEILTVNRLNLANVFGVQIPICLQSKKNWPPYNVGSDGGALPQQLHRLMAATFQNSLMFNAYVILSLVSFAAQQNLEGHYCN